MNPEELEDRLVSFAVRIGRVADALPDSRMGHHVADQIVRSGTAPAPHYAEGCAAESRRDFAHKLSITPKELRETQIWLRIIRDGELLSPDRLDALQNETNQLCKIIASSILTAKENDSR